MQHLEAGIMHGRVVSVQPAAQGEAGNEQQQTQHTCKTAGASLVRQVETADATLETFSVSMLQSRLYTTAAAEVRFVSISCL